MDLPPRIQVTHEIRALWDFDDPARSEAKFEDYAASAKDPDIRAEALTQKARAQGLQSALRTHEGLLNSLGKTLGKARQRPMWPTG